MGLLTTAKLHLFRECYGEYKAHADVSMDKKYPAHDHPENRKGQPKSKRIPFRDCHQWGNGKAMGTQLQSVTVKVCGVWDTVGSLGLPKSGLSNITGWNNSYEFHDTAINKRSWPIPNQHMLVANSG